jgi:nicotinamidase-related amidase
MKCSFLKKGLVNLFLLASLVNTSGFYLPTNQNTSAENATVNIKQTIPHYDNIAVLLIDMQYSFMDDLDGAERQELVANQNNVLDYCKEHGISVYEIKYLGEGDTINSLQGRLKELEQAGNLHQITKPWDDSFQRTDLADQLTNENIEYVLLMGLYASACVEGTGKGTLRNGFQFLTSRSLIADPDYWGNDENIEWFRTRGLHRDKYTDLLNIISTGSIEKNMPKKLLPYWKEEIKFSPIAKSRKDIYTPKVLSSSYQK